MEHPIPQAHLAYFRNRNGTNLAILIFLYCLTASIFYLLFTTEVVSASEDILALRLTILVLLAPIFIKYLIQLVLAPWYNVLAQRPKKHSSASRLPRVSVMIPAWNEEVGIRKTIESVLNTNYQNLELVVINDGSTDTTDEIITTFISQNHALPEQTEIKYLKLKNGGKAKALNQGLEICSGEFIITIDADSVMDKHAITHLLQRFDDPKVGAVAGNVIVANRKKPIALLQQLEYLYGFFFKRADSIFNAVYIIGGAAAAYRKSTLNSVGGFNAKIITEDIEMSTRILSHGYKTRYAADAVIYTEGPSDWRGLCQQRLRWKFGRLLTFIKHKDLFFNTRINNPYLTFLILPIAVYAELALLFEAFLLAIFYSYTIYTQDYLPLVFVIVLMTVVVTLIISFDSKARFHRNIICLAPVAWVVFYIIDAVELQALFRSLKRLAKHQDIEWQKWKRVGVMNQGIKAEQPTTERTIAKTVNESATIETISIIAGMDQRVS